MRSVALVGPCGSGKSTLAAMLARHWGYARHSWADAIRDVARMAYPNIEKQDTVDVLRDGERTMVNGRMVLQGVGGALRLFSEDFWVQAGEHRLPEGLVVNDDTRFPLESDALRRRGFLIVKLNAPREERRMRALVWNETDISEQRWTEIQPDAMVNTTGSVQESYAILSSILR